MRFADLLQLPPPMDSETLMYVLGFVGLLGFLLGVHYERLMRLVLEGL